MVEEAQLTFRGNGLSEDLVSYLERVAEIDVDMTDILATHISKLLKGNTDEKRKSIRSEVNQAVRVLLSETPETKYESQQDHEVSAFKGEESKCVAPEVRYFLTELSVEGFRGIRNEGSPLTLKFDPCVVNSVFAPNGMGKSSIYEALQYAIKGEVPHLADMQSHENPDRYLSNLFHSSGESTIKLRLRPDDHSAEVEVLVHRSAEGERTVSSPTGYQDPEGLLQSLDEDFTLLDYSTFTRFIEDTALDRGRSFSSLLGLSEYTNFRQMLQMLENTQSFNRDFSIGDHQQKRDNLSERLTTLRKSIGHHYSNITGESSLEPLEFPVLIEQIMSSLREAPILQEELKNIEFTDIDFGEIQSKILEAEGTSLRNRLNNLIKEKNDLTEVQADRSDVDFDSVRALFDARKNL